MGPVMNQPGDECAGWWVCRVMSAPGDEIAGDEYAVLSPPMMSFPFTVRPVLKTFSIFLLVIESVNFLPVSMTSRKSWISMYARGMYPIGDDI